MFLTKASLNRCGDRLKERRDLIQFCCKAQFFLHQGLISGHFAEVAVVDGVVPSTLGFCLVHGLVGIPNKCCAGGPFVSATYPDAGAYRGFATAGRYRFTKDIDEPPHKTGGRCVLQRVVQENRKKSRPPAISTGWLRFRS